MTHIRQMGLIAITLLFAILAVGQSSGYKQDLNASSGTQAPTGKVGQSQTTPQNPVSPAISDPGKSGPDPGKQAGWQDEHDQDHDKGYGGTGNGTGTGTGTGNSGTQKWRTSGAEIGSLGLIGAFLFLASVYLLRRRSKARA